MNTIPVVLVVLNPAWPQTQSPQGSQSGPKNVFSLIEKVSFLGKQLSPSFLPLIDIFQETTEFQLWWYWEYSIFDPPPPPELSF